MKMVGSWKKHNWAKGAAEICWDFGSHKTIPRHHITSVPAGLYDQGVGSAKNIGVNEGTCADTVHLTFYGPCLGQPRRA